VKKLLSVGLVSLALVLGGCGLGSKLADLKGKSEKIETKEELEKALGKPSKMESMDVLGIKHDVYIYQASDGQANFQIFNGKIVARAYTSGTQK
jgi:hypothetical protein